MSFGSPVRHPDQLTTAPPDLTVIARDAVPDGGHLIIESRGVAGAGNGSPEVSAAGEVTIAVRVAGLHST